MNNPSKNAADRTAEFRRAFDSGFAQRASTQFEREDDFLAVRVGGASYALRLTEITGLVSNKKIVHVPSRVPEFLGIAGFRGVIMPVYDLSALMGHGRAEDVRWLVVLSAAPMAMAFEASEGHLRVPSQTLTPISQAGEQRRHVKDILHRDHGLRPVINFASVLADITQRKA